MCVYFPPLKVYNIILYGILLSADVECNFVMYDSIYLCFVPSIASHPSMLLKATYIHNFCLRHWESEQSIAMAYKSYVNVTKFYFFFEPEHK